MAEHIPTMQASYKALVKGITSLDFGNKTPCILYLTTEKAFPLLVDSAGETLIAASRFGQGKVVILPNKEYLTMPSFLPFLQNAVTWLKPPSVPEVGVQSSFASLAKFLTSKAHKVQTSDTFNKSYGVYCTHADDKSQELVAFIKNGGGLLIAGQPDPTAATNDADVFEAYSGNKITGVTGIQFSKLQSKAGVYPFTENIPLYILKVNETIIAPHMNSLRKDAYNSEVKSTANSSPLFVYGSHSFPLFQTKDGGNFVAGAMYGRGRVLVISHKDLLTFPEFKSFPEKALDWLDGGRKGKVGFTDNMSHLRDININLSKVEKPIKIPNLDPSLSVICCDAYTEQDTDKILEFVAEGGGLLVNGHAWTWIVNNTKKNPLTDLPANKILWNMGIIIPGGSVKVSDYEPMNSKDFSSYYNFLSILKLLERFTKKEDTKIFNSTHVSWYPIISLDFNSLLKMSQENNLQIRCIFDLINKIFSNLDVPNLPININNKNACLLHLQTLYYNQYATEEESKPEWMKITPIPPNSPVENVLIDGNNKDSENRVWKSTGFYLPPKSLASFTFPSAVVTSGLQIQIGCQTDNNLSVKANEYIRAPQVTLSLPITKETIKLFTLWGGLVYIILPKGAKLGQFSVTVHGVQKAPYFQKGKTSLSDWRDTIRHYPAPWAELAADNVILSVPTENILSLDNPEELLQFWDEALAKVAELAAIPGHPHPERIVLDVQIPGGSMHSGYPIVMTHADMNTLLDLKKIKDFGTWGIIHELGHNQQKSGWNWEGTNESSNNLWSVYVHEKVVKVSWETAHRQLNPSRREQRIKDYLKDGANIKEWKLFVALETYLQLQEAFGWKPFIELFGDYQKIKYENTDEYKRNLWVELFSQKVKKNLVPFFKMWGFPITAATSDKLSALPEWKENPMKKYVEK